MDLQLAGKVAVVTGGSRGIGKSAAVALAREGVDIAVVSRDPEIGARACGEIAGATGREVRFFAADTGSDAEVQAAVAAIMDAFGRIDILVNCAAQPAGQSRPPALAEVTDQYFWDDVNVKVVGYLRMARAVAPHMKAQGWGRIINVSGLAARRTGSIVGSIRNVAVAALTKNLADELGRHGINVTCLHPGLTRTEKTPGVQRRLAEAQGVAVEEIERRMASGNTIGRLIEADDLGPVVAFLASPLSLAITGESIAAGGGEPGVIHY